MGSDISAHERSTNNTLMLNFYWLVKILYIGTGSLKHVLVQLITACWVICWAAHTAHALRAECVLLALLDVLCPPLCRSECNSVISDVTCQTSDNMVILILLFFLFSWLHAFTELCYATYVSIMCVDVIFLDFPPQVAAGEHSIESSCLAVPFMLSGTYSVLCIFKHFCHAAP